MVEILSFFPAEPWRDRPDGRNCRLSTRRNINPANLDRAMGQLSFFGVNGADNLAACACHPGGLSARSLPLKTRPP